MNIVDELLTHLFSARTYAENLGNVSVDCDGLGNVTE